MSHFCFVSLENIWGIFSCHRTEPTHWCTENIFLAKKLQFLRHLHVCYQPQQLPPFFRVIFTEKKCFYHFAYFWVHSNLSMTSKPNSDVGAGQPARLTLSQVTDSPFTQQPPHTCYSGTFFSKITCDRPLRPLTHDWNQGSKTLNGKGLLYSTLLQFSCIARDTFEHVELFVPASDGADCYIFSILVSAFYGFFCLYPCQTVISLCFAYL